MIIEQKKYESMIDDNITTIARQVVYINHVMQFLDSPKPELVKFMKGMEELINEYDKGCDVTG